MKNKVLFCRVSEATHNLVKERAGDQGITNFLECAIHSYLNKRDEQIIDAIVDGVVGEHR